MNPQQTHTAHSLYRLYESLPEEVQKYFLEELIQKRHAEIKALTAASPPQPEKRNRVIFGIMEGAFDVPDNFDDDLPDEITDEFYADKL